MCRKMMNTDNIECGARFKNINTSVCEQFFSSLTKSRCSLRGFNYPTSTLFSLLLFHLKNSRATGIKTNAFGLDHHLFADKIKPHFVSPCVFEGVYFDLNQKLENSKENQFKEQPDKQEQDEKNG